MKYSLFINCVLLIVLLAFSTILRAQTGKPEKPPVSLIFDTDIGPDYDDVGAMAILHALADQKEVRILAVMASNRHPLVAPVINLINTWYGRPEIPIGAPKGASVNLGSRQKWADSLVAHFPHKIRDTDSAVDAVALYRKILSSSPDKSVVVVTVGFLTNLANLLRSVGDSISSLDGKELVSRKIKYWVAMAGRFPEGKEFNIVMDTPASLYAIANWPTPVIFSGFEIGEKILTGVNLVKNASPHNPIAEVYRISMPLAEEDRYGRKSWDQTAVLVAIKGKATYFDIEKGTFEMHTDGSNGWIPGKNGRHERLIFKMPVPQLTATIEQLMSHEPILKE